MPKRPAFPVPAARCLAADEAARFAGFPARTRGFRRRKGADATGVPGRAAVSPRKGLVRGLFPATPTQTVRRSPPGFAHMRDESRERADSERAENVSAEKRLPRKRPACAGCSGRAR